MNVLYGLYSPTEGTILVDDKPVTFTGPGDAMAAGIGMVHQHFMLVPVFTVAENVALGNETVKAGGMLNLAQTRTRIQQISDQYGFDVDPDAVVEDLRSGSSSVSKSSRPSSATPRCSSSTNRLPCSLPRRPTNCSASWDS
jgi:simple sugar transport system ATP-binding protein